MRFGGEQLVKQLNAELATHKHKVLINLASEEYFKAIPLKALDVPGSRPCSKTKKKSGSYKNHHLFCQTRTRHDGTLCRAKSNRYGGWFENIQ